MTASLYAAQRSPRAKAELECERCSAVRVFDHLTDHPKNSLPECLYNNTVLSWGKAVLGVSSIVGTTSFCSPAPGHAQSNYQTCFFPSSAFDVPQTPLRCVLVHVVSAEGSVEVLDDRLAMGLLD